MILQKIKNSVFALGDCDCGGEREGERKITESSTSDGSED
jgi:hypothetical protein